MHNGDAMSNIVLIGKNPYFRDIIEYAFEVANVNVSGVFLDPEQDNKISEWLKEIGIHSYPQNLLTNSDKAVSILKNIEPDYLINYNSIIVLKPEILGVMKTGSLNMHPGLLPSYSGLHTHQWAIRNGEKEFGSTLHWMKPRVDAGDIVSQEKFSLTGKETGLSLYLKCLQVGKQLIEKALDLISDGKPLPQISQNLDERKVYLSSDAQDGRIDWSLSANEILRFFLAADYGFFESPTYKPQSYHKNRKVFFRKAKPGNHTTCIPGTILSKNENELEVACGDNKGIIMKVKNPGKIEFNVGDTLNSYDD